MLEARGLCKSYGEPRRRRRPVARRRAPARSSACSGRTAPASRRPWRCCAAWSRADRGEVFVGSGATRSALDENAHAAKRRIGLVPQELSIYENLGAAANLELFGALYGLAGALLARARRRGARARRPGRPRRRQAADLQRRHEAAPQHRRRAGPRPRRADLDEPTVGVDPQSRNAIFDNLETLRGRGKALLYTTHYMEEAERLCDRVVIMDHGRVVASDTLAGLYKRLPAVETLELEVDGAVDLVALGARPASTRPTQDGTRLHAGVADLGRVAPALLCVARRARPRRAPHLVGRADLEDVFLSLTGRQLRD